MQMRITIIGLGAMGSLFAARLSHLADITLLGSWQAQIDSLNSTGLTLIHPDGRTTHHALQAANDPTRISPADLVLIMVKTPKTAAAARLSKQLLTSNGLVITLQNGLGNLETIAAVLEPELVAQGVTSEGAAMLEAGVVRHAGAGQTYLAESTLGTDKIEESRSARLREAADLFNDAGFETQVVRNADSLIWGKLAVNAGINPLSALLQVPNGFLLENKDAHWLMSRAAAETADVAQALGITLPYQSAAERTAQVAQATAANHSSMAQDVARGVTTEIDAICGVIVHYGHQHGIPTPVNQTLQMLVQKQTDTGNWHDAISNLPAEILPRFARLINRNESNDRHS
jgi:2-dehydropantoate 2-reductase